MEEKFQHNLVMSLKMAVDEQRTSGIVAWAIPTPLHCSLLTFKTSARFCTRKVGISNTGHRRPYILPNFHRSARMASDQRKSGNDEDSSDEVKNSGDWDTSWSEFSKRRSDGVFQLPTDDSVGNADRGTSQNPPKGSPVADKRTERLTSLWSNENGFLVGIGVLFLIAMFYIYVYNTGGISH